MGRQLTTFLILVAFGAACGDFGDSGTRGLDGDGGPDSLSDASTTPPPGNGLPEGIPADGDADDPSPSAGEVVDDGLFAADRAATCFDGKDNDGDGVVDCDEDSCGSYFSCSIGHGDRCRPGDSRTIDVGSCNGMAVGPCLGGREFGTSWVAGSMLHPGGGAESVAGVELVEDYDLTSQRIHVSADFGYSPCDNCVETATLGFTTQHDLTAGSPVRPLVALSLGASRDEMSLIVNEEVIDRWELTTSVESWGLILRPNGRLTVERRGGELPKVYQFLPAADARLVLYGRNHNRGADEPDGARIGDITITPQRCDMPASWTGRDPLTIRLQTIAAYEPDSPSAAPSVAHHDGETAIAFEEDGAIYFGFRGAGPTDLILDTRTGAPALLPDQHAYQNTAVRDPELYRNPAKNDWLMLFTAVDESGTRSIGRASRLSMTEPHLFVADSLPLLHPDNLANIVQLEQPTIAVTGDGTWILVARATYEDDGSQSLVVFHSSDTDSWTRFVGGGLEALTRRGDATSRAGFDADEIAHPSLVIHNSAYQLYYEGRRGARSGLGLLASDQLVLWRDVSFEGPVLAGSGAGFDRLSVRAPDVAVRAGLFDLLYIGVEMGADARLGRAARIAGVP